MFGGEIRAIILVTVVLLIELLDRIDQIASKTLVKYAGAARTEPIPQVANQVRLSERDQKFARVTLAAAEHGPVWVDRLEILPNSARFRCPGIAFAPTERFVNGVVASGRLDGRA